MASLNETQSARGVAAIAAAAALAKVDGPWWDASDVITLAEWILGEEPEQPDPEPVADESTPARRVTRVTDRQGDVWEHVADDVWREYGVRDGCLSTYAELKKDYGPLTPVADEPEPDPQPDWAAIDSTNYVTDVNGAEWQRVDLDLWSPSHTNTPVEALRTTAELIDKFGPITPIKEH